MINDLKKKKHLFVVPPTPARLPHQDAVGREIEIESRKRDEVQSRIDEEKMRLMHCETRLSKLQSSNEAYAKMVKEAEAAYKKIEESSQTLLHVMKREQIKQIWIDKFASGYSIPICKYVVGYKFVSIEYTPDSLEAKTSDYTITRRGSHSHSHT
eukprot:scaffold28017_cov132-Skeletonema_marinoi.AAC.1